MELVLIRHGIAETGTGSMPDADRALTRKGRRRLEAAMPAYCLLLRKKPVRIWTSPLARARESAEIIVEGLDAGPAERYDAIASGSFEALTQLLAKADPNDCIVIVGHQPHLGKWSSRICGLDMPFRKGAIAAFSYDPTSSQGDLLWFLQPGTLRRLSRHL